MTSFPISTLRPRKWIRDRKVDKARKGIFSAGLSVKVVVTVHGALDRASEAIPV